MHCKFFFSKFTFQNMHLMYIKHPLPQSHESLDMVRKQIYAAICLFNNQIFDGTTLAKNYITCYMNISILAITIFKKKVSFLSLCYFNNSKANKTIFHS
jgi:hypothetical protein